MRSIEMALAADLARRGKAIVPVTLLIMIALPLWLFGALQQHGQLASQSKEAVAMHVTLTLVLGFGAIIAALQTQGRLARFFLRPVSAARLVAILMVLSSVTAAAMYLCAASIVNLRGVQWPLLGPMLFIATMLACAQAAIWTFEGTLLGQTVACTTFSVPLVIWFSRCYGAKIMGDWQVMWRQPTALEALTLLGISGAAYGIAVIGVARVRRGDQWEFTALHQWWQGVWLGQSAARTFSSPLAAQLWCEWRQKYGVVPALVIGCLTLLMLALRLVGWLPTSAMLEVSLYVPPCLLLSIVTPIVLGFLAGNCGSGNSWNSMRSVMATRPVSDSFLATAILRLCLLSLAAAWGTWLVGLALVVGLAALLGDLQDVNRWLALQNKEWLIVCPIISWTLTTILATLMATGRPWLTLMFLVGTFGMIVGMSLLAATLPTPLFQVLYFTSQVLLLACFLLGTAAAFVIALRQRLISPQRAAWTIGLWALAVLGLVLYLQDGIVSAASLLAILGSVLALVILPIAAMPLAVRWNRHR